MPHHVESPVLPPFNPRACACLVTTRGAPVPLEGVDVRGEVYGAHARVVLRQRYRNEERAPVEAIYTFPVPSEAALVGFAMECGGRRLEAEVKEREEAFARYDEALSSGHGAALLDEERRNVFTASVGNLLPGEETVVEVAYVQALRADEGTLRLMIPTVVAPRYVPGTPAGDRTGHGAADPTDQVRDADRISPKIGAVDYGFTLDVLFDLGRAVDVESPSHGVRVEREAEGRTRVRLRRAEAPLDRDLVLVASGAGDAGDVIAGVVADRRGGGAGTLALTVVPDLFDPAERAGRRDVVFLVDTSGSMAGASMDQARAALRLCLRQLGEGDRFQIIAFANEQTAFYAKPMGFTQRRLEEADRWIAALVADGGTEMLAPVLSALDGLPPSAGRDRILVLLTDGQVANEDAIVEQAVARAAGVRVYTFGIGTAVSEVLVNDLARRTGGAAELIHPGERIDDKVTAQFARAIAARVVDVKLSFEGIEVDEIAPGALPDLVDGEPWVVYGRYGAAGLGRAVLRGERAGARFHLEIAVDLLRDARRPGLAQLWARARIRDLEEARLDGRRGDANKKRILALSIEHQVASKLASFVVVDRRTGDRLAHGQPEVRPIPVSAPAGWAVARAATRSRSAAPARPMQAFAMSARSPYGAPPAFGGSGAPPPASYPVPQQLDVAMASDLRASASDEDALGGRRSAGRIPAPASRAKGSVLQAIAGVFRAEPPRAKERVAAASGPGEIFAAQLANGLWAGAADTDAARLLATARALAAAFAAGLDASHAVFGGQIKKAIDAILAAAPALLETGAAERDVSAALLAAFFVATGRRRDRLHALVAGSGLGALGQLFANREGARQRLAELTALDAAQRTSRRG